MIAPRLSRWPTVATLFALLLALSPPVTGQDAVVLLNINLRPNPTSDPPSLRLMLPGTELFILDPDTVNGYLRAETADGLQGWAYVASGRVELLETPEDPGPPEVFNGCSIEGDTEVGWIKVQNTLKNRHDPPEPGDFNASVTLAALQEPGDDEDRFSNEDAVGRVHRIVPAGPETVNCDATGEDELDTHIELVASPTDTARSRRFVVEIYRATACEVHPVTEFREVPC